VDITLADALFSFDVSQKPTSRLVRTALLVALYILMFGDDDVRPAEVQLTYRTVRKVLSCLLLLCVADLIKAVLAKYVAGHFHNSLHFTKMQDALNKVFTHSLPLKSSCLCFSHS
jgi:hypothetical protein